jgi:soluble lytic murein transglycosylase-like protein
MFLINNELIYSLILIFKLTIIFILSFIFILLIIPKITFGYTYSATNIIYTIQQSSKNFGVPVVLIEAVIKEESHFHINAISNKGAIGLMQLMPTTATMLGVNPYNPIQNIIGGTEYLRYCLDSFNWNYVKALACYNAGPRNAANGFVPYGYINNITRYINQFTNK